MPSQGWWGSGGEVGPGSQLSPRGRSNSQLDTCDFKRFLFVHQVSVKVLGVAI